MDAINTGFNSTNLFFNLQNISRSVNPLWYHIPDYVGSVQTQMKQTLRVGGAADLNIYSVGSIRSSTGSGVLGYAYLPSAYASIPIEDGVVAVLPSLPGAKVTVDWSEFNIRKLYAHRSLLVLRR